MRYEATLAFRLIGSNFTAFSSFETQESRTGMLRRPALAQKMQQKKQAAQSSQPLLEQKVKIQPEDPRSAKNDGRQGKKNEQRGSEGQKLRAISEHTKSEQRQESVGGDPEKVAEVHGAHEVAGLLLEHCSARRTCPVHGESAEKDPAAPAPGASPRHEIGQ
jgi:hypothetical protein